MTPNRIKFLMDYKNMAATRLEKEADVPNATIYKALKNDRPLTRKMAKRVIVNFPEVNEAWWINGIGDPINKNKVIDKFVSEDPNELYRKNYRDSSESNVRLVVNEEHQSYENHYLDLPFLPITAQASFMESNTSIYSPSSSWDTYRVYTRTPNEIKKCIVFEIMGASMQPTLYDGAKVAAEPIPLDKIVTLQPHVYIFEYGDFFVAKRIKENKSLVTGMLELLSDNQEYGGMTVRVEDIRAVCKVIKHVDSPVY